MRYDKEELREKVHKILDWRVEWKSVDVVPIVEITNVDGWEEEGQERVVVLVSRIWPTDEEASYRRKQVDKLKPEVQKRCQEVVGAIHALMCEHSMPDVHAEIKEGEVEMLAVYMRQKTAQWFGATHQHTGCRSRYQKIPTLGDHVRLQTPFDVELARILHRPMRKDNEL